MKKIKMNSDGKDLFIKISGVDGSEAEIIAKMLGVTIEHIVGIQADPDTTSATDAEKLAAEMEAAGVNNETPDHPSDAPLDIPEETTEEKESESESGLSELLAIINDNKAIGAMGLDAFIYKAAPYSVQELKEFGITDLDVFLKKGTKQAKNQLGNKIVSALRKLTRPQQEQEEK